MMWAGLRGKRGFVLFLIGLAFFRTAPADWNPVPMGSLRPTLLEGDGEGCRGWSTTCGCF